MNRRFDVMETLGLNRRTRNGGASRKRGPKSNGKSPQPKGEKTRLARLEQLEERALLAVSAAEFATDSKLAAEVAELTERELSTLDLTELNAVDESAAVALLDSLAQTPSTVSYGLDASCVVELDPTLATPPSIIGFGTEAITVDATPLPTTASAGEPGEPTSSASSLVVTTNSDAVDDTDGVTSLREAIAAAQTGDTIMFAASLKGQTITLSGTQLEITKGITVDASSLCDASTQTPGITIDANQKSRVFYVSGGTEANPVALIGLTITGGKTIDEGGGVCAYSGTTTLTNCAVSGNTATYGGGIYAANDANMTFVNSAVSGNTAGHSGGGVYVRSGSTTLTNCAVSGNTARYEGGGFYVRSGSTTFTNCAVSGNTAEYEGGGVYLSHGWSRFTNCTISGNSAELGGGVSDNNYCAILLNTIVALNYAKGCDADIAGLFSSYNANNLIGFDPKFVVGPVFDADGNLTNADALDLRLTSESWAIDRGDNSFISDVSNDLAGTTRVKRAWKSTETVDIGAHEYRASFAKTPETPSLVVTTTDDVVNDTDGEISLREAILYARYHSTLGSTITFAPSEKGKKITLTSGQLIIEQSVRIDASALYDAETNVPGITVDANQKSRVFHVRGGAEDNPVALIGLKIIGGKTDGAGGGVFVHDYSGGATTFANCVISGNTASSNGGGVHAHSTTTFTNCVISGNTASGNYAFGGGVCAYGTSTFTDCVISGNTASGDYSIGGGVYSDYTTFMNSVISGNTAGGKGGGVYTDAYFGSTFTNSVISGNTAGREGGGVYFVSDGDMTTFTNCTINGNTACHGGGIYVPSHSMTTLYNTIIVENKVAEKGGDIYCDGTSEAYNTLSSFTDWSNEDATDVVNYVYNASQPLFTDAANGDYTLAPNSQAIDKGNDAYAVDAEGDALATDLAANSRIYGSAVDLGAYEYCRSNVALTSVTINGILKTGETLTANVSPDGATASYQWYYGSSANYVTNEIKGATAQTFTPTPAYVGKYLKVVATGTGSYCGSVSRTTTSAVEKGLLVVTTNLDVVDDTDGVLSLREAIAVAENGETITFDASLKGQTITLNGTELEIAKDIIVDASSLYDAASNAPGITVDANQASRVFYVSGGAEDAPVALVGLKITGGKANDGGGLYVYSGTTTLTNCAISGNTATNGGGVYAYSGATTFANCTINGNEASSNNYDSCGGGVYVLFGPAMFTNCAISDNIASSYYKKSYGGGVYGYSGPATFTNCTISGNTAGFGGGICNSDRATSTFTNCAISGNTASNGGGVYVYSGAPTFTNCTISGNTASNGGGVYAYRGTTTLCNVVVVLNTVSWSGADVYDDYGATINAFNTLSSYEAWDAGSNNYAYDAALPLFTDAENGDYSLAPNSQALNKGNNQYAHDAGLTEDSYDLAGRRRFLYGTIDLGAYESDAFDASQSGVFNDVVDFTWEQPFDEAVALRLTWISGAKSSVLGMFGASGEFAWDTTSFDDGAGRLIVEYLDENNAVLKSATIAATIINDENVVVKRGTIGKNEIWEAGKVYLVVGRLDVASGATLTLGEGAVVKFWRGATIYAQEGAGVAVGDAATLTRAEDDAVGGDTNKDGENSVAKYGASYFKGQGNVQVSASATVKYVTTTISGTLKNNETWLGGQVYRVTGDLVVPSGVMLTILPGAILKFDAGKSLIVEKGGTLIAEGTSAAPIVFTSIKDDAVGGDTNADNGRYEPQPGDWNQILVFGKATFEHAQILYSGSDPNNSYDGAIFAKGGGAVALKSVVVAHSKLVAAHADQSSTLTAVNSVFSDAMYATHNGDYLNCTFANLNYLCNTNYYYYSGSFVNCVIADVTKKFMSGGKPSYNFANCVFWNAANSGEQTFYAVGSNGNIWANPLFRNAANGDYRLSAGSPCIDAADGTLAPETDADGTPRFTDAYSGQTGTPDANGVYVDIGAYEFADVAASSLDLEPVDLKAPTSAAVGETVTLEWTTRNNGTVAATGAWSDEIYIVSASGREILVATILRAAAIGAGDLQTSYAQVTIPKSVKAGEWTFAVRVNPNRDVFEGDATANNVRTANAKTTISVPYLVASETFASTTELEYYKLYVPANTTYYLKYTTVSELVLKSDPTEYETTLYLGEGYLPTERKCDATSSSWNLSALIEKKVGAIYAQSTWETVLCVPASNVEREVYVGVRAKEAETVGSLTLEEGNAFRVLGFEHTTYMSVVSDSVYGTLRYAWNDSNEKQITIVGTGFYDGMSAVLTSNDEPALGGVGEPLWVTPGPYYPTIEVVSPTKAILTFHERVNARTPKDRFLTHDYVLTVDGSESLDLTVREDGWIESAFPTATLELPDAIRAGRVYQGTIRYSNETSDLLAPLFVLSANEGTQLSLTEDFSDATNTLQVLGLGKSDPGTLAYGDSGEITFYFKSEGNVNINLGCLDYDDNEACDDTTYFATWREYHEALIAATKRLNARGKTNYSAQDAFALAVQTKLGEPASAISGYLEDSRDLEPIAGATLFARWIAEDGATRVRYFETDENGWFSLDYLPSNTTFTLGTVDADALSQTTVTLGDSDVNGLRLTALSKDKTQTRAVAVGADLLAYVVYDKASLTNNRTAQATLIVQNTSDKPVDAALLTLTATNDRGERNAMLTLDAAQAQVPYFSTFMPDGFASSISLLTSGASNGVLGPGETLEIPVYWGGWVKPWDSASFEFELSLVEKTETAALDAAEMEKSLRESFTTSRGAAWADDEWALVWASASETFGSRWGDYVSSLLDASATAAQNGREANDVDKLTQTIFARALDAFSPYAIPASSVDAAVGSDASSLTFERVYLGDLSKRFLDSPLGRGWRHNWDYALRSNDDGTVYVDTPSGATRAFQPSRRGAAGTILTSTGTDDQGVLLRASDGTFELTELDGTKALFDADGRLTRIVDANGNAVDLTYDGAGLLTRVADGWGHSLTLRYSAKRLVAVVDSNGDETTFERDGAYLTKATGPTGRSVSYRYGDSGGALNALSEIEFADGTTRRFEYDATGRRVGVVDSDGAAERIEWLDATSYKVFDGDVCQGTVYLNDDGAPTKSVDALNRTTVYVYDKDGRLLETTDAQGKTTRYEYDGAGNAVLSVDANGSTLGFEYDAKSFLTKLTDGNGNSSVFEYDAAGNQTLWERVDGTSSSWSYAENGTLTQATDRAGATVSYEYAENGDMTSLQYSTEENAISYEYDERGNAVRIVDANGAVTTLAYDAHDRLTKVVYATGRFLEYEYDALGRQVSVSDGGDYYVGYAYDAQGRLSQVLDASGTAITVYAYDAQGRLSREEASNGVYTVYAYDALSRLTSKATFTVDGDAISSFAYTYDALDLVQTLTTLDGVWTYAYDATGQITASTFDAAPGSSLANRSYEFAYDAAGNRVWSKIDGVERTYTYDNMNRLLSDGEFEYLYDANGNLTSKTSATEAFSYVWNQRGEMLSCVASTGERWDYEYDVFGALIAVTRTDAAGNVERTEYLVDPNAELSSVVSSFDGDGNLVANYIYGLALVGQTDGAGTTAIYASDALGSTAALTGPSGETLNRYAYDQHGAVLAATETVDTPFQFVGTQGVMTGVSSELVQMRARWYDPATGRFVSEDPLGYNAGDANLYRYCGNAVTVAIDPSGLDITIGGGNGGGWNNGGNRGNNNGGNRGNNNSGNGGKNNGGNRGNNNGGNGGSIFPGDGFNKGNAGKGRLGMVSPDTVRNVGTGLGLAIVLGITGQIIQKLPTPATFGLGTLLIIGGMALMPIASQAAENPQSCDPNETRGPVGFDCVTVDANEGVEGADPFLVITTPNWTNADPSVERGFKIYFENKSTATAAAQEVFITSTLPAGYDLSSFELREVAIGNQVFDAPVGCVDGVWTVEQKATGEQIQISVEYDPATGDVKWYLRSYVASTPDHFPTDPYAGFLPPNDKSLGNGEGYVSFVVKYEDGLTTGTKPETNATIVFDANESITTNWWHNTVDADAPTAEIADILYDEEARTVAVEWRGADVGSGVACYDAYYSVDGGETYSLWLERTTETSATILASAERYIFKIVAYDNVGHSSAGVDATFEIIGADVARLDATEYVVEQNGALCLAATGETPEGWTYYWDLSGSEVEVSSNFIERGAEFWTSVEELGFGVGERTIRMRPRDANGIFGPTVAATLRVVATAPTFNVTTSSSVDGSILRLNLRATTPDGAPITYWRLDWGDGQTSDFAELSDALTAGHFYAPTAEDAVYEVSLTALDATGAGSDVVYALTSHKVAGIGASSQAAFETVASAPDAKNALTFDAESVCVADSTAFDSTDVCFDALTLDAAAVWTAFETAFDSASRGGYRLSLPDAVSTAERFDAAFAALETVASTSVLDGGEFATDCGADVWDEIEAALVGDEATRKSKRRDPFESLDVWADDELESLGAFGF